MTNASTLLWDRFDTPLGPFVVVWSGTGLRSADFDRRGAAQTKGLKRGGAANPYRKAFLEYFAGNLSAFKGLPLDLEGTGFQRSVWNRLLQIPPGTTRSYSDIAQAIGMPFAVRAVGAANGRNPVAIAVPCHRVIGKDGELTGYAGGVKRKAWLLHHENALPSRLPGY